MLNDLQATIFNLIGKLILMVTWDNRDVWANIHEETLQALAMQAPLFHTLPVCLDSGQVLI